MNQSPAGRSYMRSLGQLLLAFAFCLRLRRLSGSARAKPSSPNQTQAPQGGGVDRIGVPGGAGFAAKEHRVVLAAHAQKLACGADDRGFVAEEPLAKAHGYRIPRWWSTMRIRMG